MGQHLWKLPRVLEFTQLSRSTIYAKINDGSFPAPVKIGARAVAWRVEDVKDWFARCVEEAQVPTGTRSEKDKT